MIPQFSGVSYFLVKDIYNISEIQYGILSVLGTIGMLAGVAIYQLCFKTYEFRTLCYISLALGTFSQIVDLL